MSGFPGSKLGQIAGLLSLPAHAVFGVFQNNAAFGELVANLIAAIKVAPVTRLLAFVNQLLNFSLKNLGLRVAKDIQHAIKSSDRVDHFALVVFAQTSSRQHRIHFTREIVDGSERWRNLKPGWTTI